MGRNRDRELVDEIKNNLRFYPESSRATDIQTAQAERSKQEIINDFKRFLGKHDRVLPLLDLKKLLSDYLQTIK